ncbi:hypothetical protein BN1095_7450001 [Clostridioides difficile]|uniref:Uncharacterized protein n=1 Tax=Clostridioides difficile TaxID=1496 RepID=A0A069B1L5_CLODI|nr:hypothetical protein BN1095_7450001 [Clostridioides difficile]
MRVGYCGSCVGGEVVGAAAEFGDGGADVFGFSVFQTALQIGDALPDLLQFFGIQ